MSSRQLEVSSPGEFHIPQSYFIPPLQYRLLIVTGDSYFLFTLCITYRSHFPKGRIWSSDSEFSRPLWNLHSFTTISQDISMSLTLFTKVLNRFTYSTWNITTQFQKIGHRLSMSLNIFQNTIYTGIADFTSNWVQKTRKASKTNTLFTRGS